MADSYSLKAILSAVDGISPVLKNVATFSKSARKYLGDVGSSLNALTSKLGIPLGVVTAIGAGFGFTAIKKAIVDFADLGEAAQKGALKAGMSTDDWQRYKYVFDQAGVSVDAMEGSLGKLNKNLGNAGSGKNKDLEALLKTLGIPLRGVNGQVRNAAELLPQLADAFVKNRDPVKQAAIGNALFGKSFAEMLPLLNEGSAGINRSLARIKSLKGIISQDDLKGAKEFGDQLKDLNIVTKGFQMTIAKELVPVLSPLIEDFIQWAAVNKKLIATEVKKMVQDLVKALKEINWTKVVQDIRAVFNAIGGLVDSLGGAKNALILLAVVMNLQTIAAAWGLIASLGRLGLALLGISAQAAGASISLGYFAASQASVGAALTGSLKTVAASAGLLAAAAVIGYAIGSVIYSTLLEDTRIADWIGSIPTRVAAFFGSADAQRTLDNNAAVARMFGPQQGGIAPAAQIARSPLPAAAPGALGSGTFNINAPAAASLNGKVEVDFKNAPPGMMVTQAKADGGRVAMNTNVGYRSLSFDSPL